MEYKVNEFDTLRSDYEETLKILRKYEDRDELDRLTMSNKLRKDTWVIHFSVSCTDKLWDEIHKELERDWLIYDSGV